MNASTKLSMNGKSPMISTAPPFVLRLSKDERRVFQQNQKSMSDTSSDCWCAHTIYSIACKFALNALDLYERTAVRGASHLIVSRPLMGGRFDGQDVNKT